MMDPRDFERDLEAWLDGELPEDAAARMKAAADASPAFAERAALHRAIDARIRGALSSEPAAVATVAAMAARARGDAPSAIRRPWYLRPMMAAAAVLLVAGTIMWWFCIGPFECRFLMALEKAAVDTSAVPGARADDLMRRSGLPDRVGEAIAMQPAVALAMEFAGVHANGLRVEYVRPDHSSFFVTVSECPTRRPSEFRKTEIEGRIWWKTDYDGHRMVAFDRPQCPFVYCVVGPAGADCVFDEAVELRDAIQ